MDGRLVTSRESRSPGEEFTVEILDALERPAVHRYLAILDQQDAAGWTPVYILAAPWGQIEGPWWTAWNGMILSKGIGLRGPLRYQLPPETVAGRYRLREANGLRLPVIRTDAARLANIAQRTQQSYLEFSPRSSPP
jgi:hypothetical protein